MEDAYLETIKRRFDEPKLEIGATVLLKDGHRGVVLARYTPSAHKDEVRYIVQVAPESQSKNKH